MKTLILMLTLVAGLASGCGDSCTNGCEDDYDDCVDEGNSESRCKLLRSRCVDACDKDAEESTEDEE